MAEVSTLMALFASFNVTMTARTAESMAVLLRGAILAVGPRTATGCVAAAWPWANKHWATYGDVLRRSKLRLPILGRTLFPLIAALLPRKSVIELAIDESLVRRYGPRIIGVGMHRDSVQSGRGYLVVTPGHKWVVLAVVVKLPFVHRALALPLATALFTAKKQAKRNRASRAYRRHRSVNELALLLVRMVVRWAPDRRFRVIGDGAYGTHALADALNPKSTCQALRCVSLVSRLHAKAQLFGFPPEYKGVGRPRTKGRKLPNPREAAADPKRRWQIVEIDWYGATRKTVHLCFGVALWYRCGNMAKRIRWVVARDPDGKRRDEVFFTTDLTLTAPSIVQIFVRRWSLETTFQEMRRELGLETLRNWHANAVRRSVPLLLGVYSLVVVWFARHVENPESHKQDKPWYKKPSITFSDMLAAARQDLLNDLVFPPPSDKALDSKPINPLIGLELGAERRQRRRA